MNKQTGIHLKTRLHRKNFRLHTELELPGHGITVLFGPSGSGKTTLLRCVAGLERAEGSICINGQIWQDDRTNTWIPTYARDIGYVFQEASLFEHLNVRANLQYGIRRTRKAGSHEALHRAINLLGIEGLLDRSPQDLSGGERQRIAIARALATQPSLLLLDEPLAALDIARRQEIMPWLERVHQAWQIPMLYVTHNLQELTRLADYVVCLDAGSVELHGEVRQVLATPTFAQAVGSDAVSVLFGTILQHDHAYHLTQIDVQGGSLWVPFINLNTASQVRVQIHANDISLAIGTPSNSSIQNILVAQIESTHADTHPACLLVTLHLQNQRLLARITRKAWATLALAPGDPVSVQIKSVAIMGAL
jgi:molybdate transport system ATP-binding protein